MQKSILILETEQGWQSAMLKTFLDKNGFRGVFSSDMGKASEALATEPFDLILVDMEFMERGGVDFFRFTSRISPLNGVKLPPILLVSSLTDAGILEFAREWGAKGCVAKPFRPEDLLNALYEHAA